LTVRYTTWFLTVCYTTWLSRYGNKYKNVIRHKSKKKYQGINVYISIDFA